MSTTVVADLGMLAAMYGSGTLDADEFKKAKAKLLRDSPAPSTGEQTTPTELDSEAEEADSSQLTSARAHVQNHFAPKFLSNLLYIYRPV